MSGGSRSAEPGDGASDRGPHSETGHRLVRAGLWAGIIAAVAGVLALIVAVVVPVLQSQPARRRTAELLDDLTAPETIRLGALLATLALVLPMVLAVRRALRTRERPTRPEIRALKQHFDDSVSGFLRELPPTQARSRESLGIAIRSAAVYVPSPYEAVAPRGDSPQSPNTSQHPDIVDFLVAAARARQNTLLVGEPGTGKTLAAAICFATLADAFLAAPAREPIPILVRLNALARDKWQGGPLDVLADVLQALDPERLALWRSSRRLVLILDGLDEMSVVDKGAATAQFQVGLRGLLDGPFVLTCREAFYSLYVEAQQVVSALDCEVRMRNMAFEAQALAFISKYCQSVGSPDLAEAVIGAVRSNACLAETVTRPLMLRMTVEVLVDEFRQGGLEAATRILLTGSDCLNADIYDRYVQRWLRREHRKVGEARLRPDHKARILQLIAGRVFNTSVAGARYPSSELTDLLVDERLLLDSVDEWLSDPRQRHLQVSAEDVTREVAERTFLLVSARFGAYRFAHKSFFEYLLARHIYEELIEHEGDEKVLVSLLKRPLPDEVVDFLRELLHYSISQKEDAGRRRLVERALLQVVHAAGGSASTLMARQQAGNLCPIVATDVTREKLRSLARSEQQHPFVRRGIAVGEALHHADAALLNDFVVLMDENKLARDCHMGYNRIYYGDQPLGQASFVDDYRPSCSRFFRASLRHLQSDRYRYIRAMDLASIKYMLRDPERRSVLLADERDGLEALRTLCQRGDAALGHVHEEQRVSVLELLTETLAEAESQPATASRD